MNILLLAPQPFFQERGTPIAVKLLAQTLVEQGHGVDLLVFAEGEDVSLPGVTVYRHVRIPGLSGIKPGLSLKKLVCDFFLFIKLVQLARSHEFHLVHAVEESVFMALLAKKIFKIPYVYDMDSCMSVQIVDKFPSLGMVRRLMERFERAAITGSVGVVAVCKALEDIARKNAPDKLIARLEDITLLDSSVTGQENLRESLGIEGVILMYVGNFEQYQGIDLLLDSFAEAVTRKNDLALVLIGGSDRDIERYKEKAAESGIGKQVYFCGQRPVSLLGYYLSQADILVSPRTQGNNTPMKIYSYLDSGRPVLATDLPTHSQVLDREISFLVKPVAGEMAEGMVQLAEDGSLRDMLGRNGRQRVQEEYSLPAFRRKLAAFYKELQELLDSER